MNIDSYIAKEGFQKLLLAEGNRPLIFLENDKIEFLSELVLNKDEIVSSLKNLGLESHLSSFDSQSFFYKNGHEFAVKTLCFSDSVRLEITKLETSSVKDLNKMNLPGYVSDWAQARKGLVFFYGADELIDQIKVSFVQERAQNTQGSTLIVSNRKSEISSVKGHTLVTTKDESFINEANFKSLDFNAYVLSQDFNFYDPLNLVRLAERGALILVHSPWSSLDKFLYSFNSWFSKDQYLKKILLQETLGFVGVKSVQDVHKNMRPVFEVMPVEDDFAKSDNIDQSMFRDTGLSFNQYLYTMLLKREISLKDAYAVSSDPEGLNSLLDEGDSAYGC